MSRATNLTAQKISNGARIKRPIYSHHRNQSSRPYERKIRLSLAEGIVFAERRLDYDEFLDIELVPLPTLVDMATSGEIKDAKTQIAVLKTHILEFWSFEIEVINPL